MPEKVTSFTIKRSKWARGRQARLVCSNGKRCAIGYYGHACGLPDYVMLERGTIEGAVSGVSGLKDTCKERMTGASYETFFGPSPSVRINIACTNDRIGTRLAERERIIAENFRAIGITVTFTD